MTIVTLRENWKFCANWGITPISSTSWGLVRTEVRPQLLTCPVLPSPIPSSLQWFEAPCLLQLGACLQRLLV